MRGQIENADWVIVICSQGYRESWEKKPSGGRGATFEAALLMQELYEQRMINRKLIPVILRPGDTNAIPRELRDSTHYLIPQQQDLMVHRILKGTWLGRFIEGFAAAEPGTVTDDLTPAEILNGAMELDKDAAELPGFAVLQKALIAEANEFVLQISNSKEAMEVEKVRLGFRRSFCPRAKQLFELAGNLPTVLKRVYEESCLR